MADVRCPGCGAGKEKIESREMTILTELTEEEATSEEDDAKTDENDYKDDDAGDGFLEESDEDVEKEDEEDEFDESVYGGTNLTVYKCQDCLKIFLTLESIRLLKEDSESEIAGFIKEYSGKGYSPGIKPGSVWAWMLGLI